MQPMEYPYDEKLSPALWGTYEVDGKVYKTGMQLLYERCEEFTLEKAAEICWLDADRIKAAIEMYLENAPSGICLWCGNGPDTELCTGCHGCGYD